MSELELTPFSAARGELAFFSTTAGVVFLAAGVECCFFVVCSSQKTKRASPKKYVAGLSHNQKDGAYDEGRRRAHCPI